MHSFKEKNVKKKLLFFARIMLIVLYISYYGSTTLFIHTHQTPYGPITHSHPFNGHHNHTKAEYTTICFLSAIAFCISLIFSLDFIRLKFREMLVPEILKYTCIQIIFHSLRAPPLIA